MAGPVPHATSLGDIYPEDAIPVQKQRWDPLLAEFQKTYQGPAEFVSRSPGRVNIIGEHIDYSLYEVLPMAVTADVLLAVSVKSPKHGPRIRISNMQSAKFPAREFDVPVEGDIPIDAKALEWSNYFKSGLKGAMSLLRRKQPGRKISPVSMDVLVDGTVPSGGGLSSSAAFVCASALAVLKAMGETTVDKKELVELAIVSEREVGVNSGGMDQSASVFSLRGSALYVTFKPSLSARAISFPDTRPEMTFLIAQSFVAADKHVTAPVNYNLRVVECSLAADVLARKLAIEGPLPEDAAPLGVSLRGLQDKYYEQKEGITDNTKTSVEDFATQLRHMIQLAEKNLDQQDGYSREHLSQILGISVAEIDQRYTSKFVVRADRFLLRQRALHVFTEALRVLDFMRLLSSPFQDSETLLKDLGALMNQTQESCRTDFDCSCAELDELCRIAREAGSYGSRLTGAGWGGCTVHLVAHDKVDAVKQALESQYYNKLPGITKEKLAEALVTSKPGSGSSVYIVTGPQVD